MIDVFDNPRSGENRQRARNISDNIIRFALSSYDSISSILKLGSRDYYTLTSAGYFFTPFACFILMSFGGFSISPRIEQSKNIIFQD